MGLKIQEATLFVASLVVKLSEDTKWAKSQTKWTKNQRLQFFSAFLNNLKHICYSLWVPVVPVKYEWLLPVRSMQKRVLE